MHDGDIKPDNVMFDKMTCDIRLGDFGLAVVPTVHVSRRGCSTTVSQSIPLIPRIMGLPVK